MGGCDTNRVFVYDRGGEVRLGEINPKYVNRIRYNRIRDDISKLIVEVQQPDPACVSMLGRIEEARHELVVFRGEDRVWEGPVTLTDDYTSGRFIMEARDVMHYPYRCILKRGYDDRYPNCKYVTQRAQMLAEGELARFEGLDPPINVLPHLTIRHRDDDARECRQVYRYQKTLWEELDSFAEDAGMDYATIGRRIVFFDVHDEEFGRTPIATEQDFLGDLIITRYGMEVATFGAATDGEGRYAWVGGEDEFYGLWERLVTIREEGESASEGPSREALLSAARALIAGRVPVPMTLRVPANTTINPDGVLQLADLVPGVRVPVRARGTVREVDQMMKLDEVVVEETPTGESIQVTLGPEPGAFDPDAPTGDDQTDEEE